MTRRKQASDDFSDLFPLCSNDLRLEIHQEITEVCEFISNLHRENGDPIEEGVAEDALIELVGNLRTCQSVLVKAARTSTPKLVLAIVAVTWSGNNREDCGLSFLLTVKEARKQKIATHLIENVLRLLSEIRVQRCYGYVENDNAPSIGLFSSLDFKETAIPAAPEGQTTWVKDIGRI